MAKIKKPVSFFINCGTYPFDILVYIGEDKEPLFKKLRKYIIDEEELKEEEDDKDQPNGKSIMFSSGQIVLYLKNFPKYPFESGILAHEIFHCADHLMNHIGTKLTPDSNETYAYLIGYITEKIYNKLKKK